MAEVSAAEASRLLTIFRDLCIDEDCKIVMGQQSLELKKTEDQLEVGGNSCLGA